MREPEGHALRPVERLALVEEAVEVHVHGVAVGRVEQDVLAVAVAEAQDVAHHGHDGGGAAVRQARPQPRLRVGEVPHEPLAEERRVAGDEALEEHLALGGEGRLELAHVLLQLVAAHVDVAVAVDAVQDVTQTVQVLQGRGEGIGRRLII